MFFIVSTNHVYPVVASGETMSDAWDSLRETLEFAGEDMPSPNSESVEYWQGDRIEVEAKIVWEMDGEPV